MQKTSIAKPATTNRKWVLIDLENKTLGRAASKIAIMLRGKDQPDFTPHVDTGNFIVIINASKVRLSGRKLDDKIYYKHSGYPGGLKEKTARDLRDNDPERLIKDTVWGMLPKNTLSRHQLKKIKVYPGSEHPHSAQIPEVINI